MGVDVSGWTEWFLAPERSAMRRVVHRPRFTSGAPWGFRYDDDQCDLCGYQRGCAGATNLHHGWWWRAPLLRFVRRVIAAAEPGGVAR